MFLKTAGWNCYPIFFSTSEVRRKGTRGFLSSCYVCRGAGHRLSSIVSFEPSQQHLLLVLLPPFYRQGNRISETLRKFPNLTHLANDRSRV